MGTLTPRLAKEDPRSGTARERHALLQRVLWSHQIKNSERIRDFLVYVCERELQEPGAEIHEQEIGHRVFGRKPDYDTAVDNVVRVTASQARKKLEQYFATDGISEPLILEIPKGKYAPVFREPDAVHSPPPANQSRRGMSKVRCLLSKAYFAAVVICSSMRFTRERPCQGA